MLYNQELKKPKFLITTRSGSNLYLVFNKMEITEDELIKHCNEYLIEKIDIIFNH